MTSLNAANLPSDDEEDDDYDPTEAQLAEDKIGKPKASQSAKKRRRGGTANLTEAEAGDQAENLDLEELADVETPAATAKKAKVDDMWAQLNKGKAPKQSAAASSAAAAQVPAEPAENTAPAAKATISLAAFCRPVASTRKADSDAVSIHTWMSLLAHQTGDAFVTLSSHMQGKCVVLVKLPGTSCLAQSTSGLTVPTCCAGLETPAGHQVETRKAT